MCGIAGILGTADRSMMEAFSGLLSHRGPNGCGIFVDEEVPVSLSHRRLSIIDLSERAAQPMSDNSGRYTIVYNGEIYNYGDLRAELEKAGHRFASDSDTETVLRSFIHWGPECVKRFRGMFAFAIVDRGSPYGTNRENIHGLPEFPYLFLARDRFGIKPLLYSRTERGFAFASELKALTASGLVPRSIAPQSLLHYISYGSVLQPDTIYEGIFHLEPGTFMIVSDNGNSVTSQRYWDLAEEAVNRGDEPAELPYQEQVKRTRNILEEATRYHLVSDVPVGAFLSGGVDSTAVVALMSREVSYPIQSFSVGFEVNPHTPDELSYARLAAESIGCDHHEIFVTTDEFTQIYEDLINTIDQPSIDGANTYLVSREASRYVKVALSGLGGDELFGGYPHFRNYFRRDKGFFIKPVKRLLGIAHQYRPNRYTVGPYLEVSTPEDSLSELRRLFKLRGLSRNLSPRLISKFNLELFGSYFTDLIRKELTPVAQMTYAECRQYLLNTLLRDVDIMSMAHSLEVRPILLDHVLAQYAFSLPDTAKINNNRLKSVLIDAIRDLVPERVWNRPKMGFELPFRLWLSGALKEHARQSFRSPTARKLFSPTYLEHLGQRLASDRSNRATWAWLVLIDWIDRTGCELHI